MGFSPTGNKRGCLPVNVTSMANILVLFFYRINRFLLIVSVIRRRRVVEISTSSFSFIIRPSCPNEASCHSILNYRSWQNRFKLICGTCTHLLFSSASYFYLRAFIFTGPEEERTMLSRPEHHYIPPSTYKVNIILGPPLTS